MLWAVAIIPLQAQDRVWVQIEAQPSLTEAQERIRDYSASLTDINGFALDTGWYGIVLGPYSRPDADRTLRRLRRYGLIPRDSFIAFGDNFSRQFWPIGAGAFTTLATPPAPQITIEPVSEAPPLIDETPQQARRSEARLTRQDRELLQKALKWAGVYTAGIDGAFGRGTRSAMRDWQLQKGYEDTGILTTAQRVELLRDYNAVLDGLDMQIVVNSNAGIQIILPSAVLAFDKYEPPLVHYRPTTDLQVQVLLISQTGDANSLLGLYDLLQTLEVMPTDGPREQNDRRFEITGVDATRHSYAYAERQGDVIKGFILVWPPGDTQRQARVQQEMQDSFTVIDGVLDPDLGPPDMEQSIDLVSGLQIRRPRLSRSGFYVDQDGTVLTTTRVIDQCARITLDEQYEAEVVAQNNTLGIAILRPKEPLSPAGVAAFLVGVPRIQDQVAVAGYPYEGVLGKPSLTFGQLADIRGLDGADDVDRLALTSLPGDAGGPVLTNTGAVQGMLLAQDQQDRQLPEDVKFSIDATVLVAELAKLGVEATLASDQQLLLPEDLSQLAADMTALVSCWD